MREAERASPTVVAAKRAFQHKYGCSTEAWVIDRVRRGLDRDRSVRLSHDLGRQALEELGWVAGRE